MPTLFATGGDVRGSAAIQKPNRQLPQTDGGLGFCSDPRRRRTAPAGVAALRRGQPRTDNAGFGTKAVTGSYPPTDGGLGFCSDPRRRRTAPAGVATLRRGQPRTDNAGFGTKAVTGIYPKSRRRSRILFRPKAKASGTRRRSNATSRTAENRQRRVRNKSRDRHLPKKPTEVSDFVPTQGEGERHPQT